MTELGARDRVRRITVERIRRMSQYAELRLIRRAQLCLDEVSLNQLMLNITTIRGNSSGIRRVVIRVPFQTLSQSGREISIE